MSLEIAHLSPTLRVRVELDPYPANPRDDFDNIGEIAYPKRSRYTLGSQAVDDAEMDAIRKGIERGTLVGMPVFAYIHSGVVLKATSNNPFPDQRWDSGQSGYVYCTREKALQEWGRGGNRMTPKIKLDTLNYLAATVDEFSAYLSGDVYGFVVERVDPDNGDVEELESCWGFVGCISDCLSEGCAAAESYMDEESHA